jgi:uncharacterized protein (DUF2141 family)
MRALIMGRAALFAALFAGAFAASSDASPTQGDLVIRVGNVSRAGGILRLGVYDEKSYPDNDAKPVASADVSVSGSEMTIVLRGIPAGDYAIQALQDVNRDGKMNTTLIGMPEEPFGFSRDARPQLSKPAFASVRFTLAAGENMQTIHLQDGVSLLP